MSRGSGDGGRESLGVEGETERGLDSGSEGLGVAEGEETKVVDLGLDERRGVQVGLDSDLEVDARGLGVVDRLGSSLGLGVDSVVVRGREEREVSERVDGGGVLRGGVSDSGGVSGDGTGQLVVRGLSSDQEAVSGSDSVGGEGRSL